LFDVAPRGICHRSVDVIKAGSAVASVDVLECVLKLALDDSVTDSTKCRW
jgi:hypothetical protein